MLLWLAALPVRLGRAESDGYDEGTAQFSEEKKGKNILLWLILTHPYFSSTFNIILPISNLNYCNSSNLRKYIKDVAREV